MFTTLAETYMIAARMDGDFARRAAESERVHLLRIRRMERKAWIAEQAREASAARRKAVVRAVLGLTGRGIERAGTGIARMGHALSHRFSVAEPTRAQPCC